MKKRIKQGFTLVELVIVIAIIAILAAVLIPTFSNLITKANESADAQMVANLNKQLAISEITDGKNETMQEAIEDAKKAGYNTGAFLSTSNDILWDQETDRFIAVKKGNKVFAQDENQKAYKITGSCYNDYKYWKVYKDSIPEIGEQKYSIYWAGGELANSSQSLNVQVGFDAGNYNKEYNYTDLMIVVYTNINNIKINLNRGTLVVSSDSQPTIDCYGIIDMLYFEFEENDRGGYGTINLHNAYIGYLSSNCTGNLVSNGAKFHEKYEELNDKKEIEGLKETDCNIHYPSEENCYFCDNNESEDKDHVHNFTTAYIAPTCEEDGKIVITCTNSDGNCKYGDDNSHSKTITIPALGHAMVENQKEVLPTCEEAGHTAVEICIRCESYTKGGDVIAPKGHNFVDGRCTVCNKISAEISHMTLSMVEGKLSIGGNIDETFDKSYQLFTVQLSSDIEIDVDELREILGSDKNFIGYDETGTAVSIPRGYSGICFVDIDLNGQKLILNEKIEYESSCFEYGFGLNIEAYGGYLRIRDSSLTKKGELILDGQSEMFGSIIVLANEKVKVEFDSINCYSILEPIYVGYENNNVIIKNSTLKMPNKYWKYDSWYDKDEKVIKQSWIEKLREKSDIAWLCGKKGTNIIENCSCELKSE